MPAWAKALLAIFAVLLAVAYGTAHAAPYLKQQRDLYQVLVIGDALGGGLFAGMERAARANRAVQVSGRYKEDSGLARPEIYDWPEAVRKIVEGQEIDIAVIMLGGNDGQDIRPPGEQLAFASPEWTEAYETQLTKLLDILAGNGAAIYWVGLPPMASAEYDEKMRTVDEIQGRVLDARGVKRIDLRQYFAGPDGGYTENGPDVSGTVTRLRARNGINFLRTGNDRLARIVLDVLEADIEAAANAEPVEIAAPTVPPEPSRSAEEAGMPLFGQDLVSGKSDILSADQLPSIGAVAVSRSVGGKEDRDVTFEQTEAVAGGSATALFASGRWPAVKPGRVDDFTLRSE